MKVEIVPATAELLTRFYGAAPTRTMRAFVGVRGDEVLGVVALIPDGNRMALISSIRPDARVHRKAIVKGAREIMRLAKRIGVPVHATPDPNISCAAGFLMKLGFREITPEVFAWNM